MWWVSECFPDKSPMTKLNLDTLTCVDSHKRNPVNGSDFLVCRRCLHFLVVILEKRSWTRRGWCVPVQSYLPARVFIWDLEESEKYYVLTAAQFGLFMVQSGSTHTLTQTSTLVVCSCMHKVRLAHLYVHSRQGRQRTFQDTLGALIHLQPG